jgi:hypothetical protein
VLRSILAVIVGTVVGGGFNMAVIMLSQKMYPPPGGADLSDPATMTRYVESLPVTALLLVLVAHAGGALVGGLVAALIARRSQLILGAVVGGLFLVGGAIMVTRIPAPLWFVVADLVLYVPCGMIGGRLAPRRAVPA